MNVLKLVYVRNHEEELALILLCYYNELLISKSEDMNLYDIWFSTFMLHRRNLLE